jgi:hypothetical protein
MDDVDQEETWVTLTWNLGIDRPRETESTSRTIKEHFASPTKISGCLALVSIER